MVPVWIKHRLYLLHLSLEEDADVGTSKQDGWSDPSQAICSSLLTVCTLQRLSKPAILFRPPRTCPLRLCLTPSENHLNFSIVHELENHPLG